VYSGIVLFVLAMILLKQQETFYASIFLLFGMALMIPDYYFFYLRVRKSKLPPPKVVALVEPLKEARIVFLAVLSPLIVFLILHISPYLFFVQPNGRNTVAAAPEVIPPVRFRPKLLVALKDGYGTLAFHMPHQL